MTYRIVIDQSTSGTKALLFKTSEGIELVSRLDKSHQQIYPQKGFVEHNPIEIKDNVVELIDNILTINKLGPEQIKSLSITNQRESIVVWDRKTGKLYGNVMVWQCNRGLEICEKLIDDGYSEVVNSKTGLTIDPYFSASKLKWFFDNHEFTNEQIQTIGIGTIETWLLWNLTNGKSYLSDISNACRTLLFNIYEKKWDTDLMKLFNVPFSAMPQVVDSVHDFGEYLGIPIISIVADSQAALYGHMCMNPGNAKATLGTGCSVLMNAGHKAKGSNGKILTTIAWQEKGITTYALEGVIRSFGDILNWERDSLRLFNDFQEASDIAFSLPSNEEVYLVPALEGLAAPFWKPNLEASFEGLSRNTTSAHLIRAGFEAMVYQIRAIIDEFENSCGVSLNELHVDGGASKNSKFMQMLSDVTKKRIICGEIEEVSAIGTLVIVGERTTHNEVNNRFFEPSKEYDDYYYQWKKIINEKVEK